MNIAAYPASSIPSRALISAGTLVASVVIGISASGTDYLPLAIPAFVGLCAAAGIFAGVAALMAARRSPKPHSVAGPALLAAGSGVLIAWACRLFFIVLSR
jgi:hypothetical protein